MTNEPTEAYLRKIDEIEARVEDLTKRHNAYAESSNAMHNSQNNMNETLWRRMDVQSERMDNHWDAIRILRERIEKLTAENTDMMQTIEKSMRLIVERVERLERIEAELNDEGDDD